MNRRQFLAFSFSGLATGWWSCHSYAGQCITSSYNKKLMNPNKAVPANGATNLVLFLCGDVMTGRGIDQILPHPSEPTLHEPYMTSAIGYVELAEKVNGPIPQPVAPDYIWGDALDELEKIKPDLRIINLETAVTQSNYYQPGKGIHYRMHPQNITCIKAASIDCCVLANNHVLDWGIAGLDETLTILRKQNIVPVGAGQNDQVARTPAIFKVARKGRVVILAFASESSGVPSSWAATADRPGVNVFSEFNPEAITIIASQIQKIKQPGDIVIASLHWGSNWGYEIPPAQSTFAHHLIDKAQVDIVYGHSSHHPKGMEVYNGKLILYGCGDFINDYEGIRGYEQFRDDLTLMYFVLVNPENGHLAGVEMIPMQIRKFRLQRASSADAQWLGKVMNRECRSLGGSIVFNKDHTFSLQL